MTKKYKYNNALVYGNAPVYSNISNEEIMRKVQEWLQSSEGKQAIQETLKNTKSITKRLQEERRVDLKSLNEPFTV